MYDVLALDHNDKATGGTHEDQRGVVMTVSAVDVDAVGDELLACLQVAPPAGVEEDGKVVGLVERVLVAEDALVLVLEQQVELSLELVFSEDVGHVCCWMKRGETMLYF